MSQAATLDPLVPLAYRVRRARRELPDIATLELVPLAGETPSFLPGQFNMLYAFGIGEVAISMSGDPARTGVFVHTVRDVGAVSGAIARLGTGAVVGVRGPYGTAWPATAAEGSDVVIVAGGLGLAPLRPAIYQVLANRARYGRVVILYGTRSPSEILSERSWRTGGVGWISSSWSRSIMPTPVGTAMSGWCRSWSRVPASIRTTPWPWSVGRR